MSTIVFPTLDPLDIQLMTELESDAKQKYKDLAKKLNISRPTVASKVQRLLSSGVVKIVCLVPPVALGYNIEVGLRISAQAGHVLEVAEKLATFRQVSWVVLETGDFHIGASAFFREREELSDFLINKLGSIPAILHFVTYPLLLHVKSSQRLLTDEKEPYMFDKPTRDLDALDMKLIGALQADARQKTAYLVRKLGVTDSTVLRRIQALEDKDIIRIRAIVHPFALGYEGVATISMNCDTNKVRKIADAVAAYRNVNYVGISAGRYDIISMVLFQKYSDLQHFTISELSKIPGLRHTETTIHHKLVKTSGLNFYTA